jgi:hypothetical protein
VIISKYSNICQLIKELCDEYKICSTESLVLFQDDAMIVDVEALCEGDYYNLLPLPSTIADFVSQAKTFDQRIQRDVSL